MIPKVKISFSYYWSIRILVFFILFDEMLRYSRYYGAFRNYQDGEKFNLDLKDDQKNGLEIDEDRYYYQSGSTLMENMESKVNYFFLAGVLASEAKGKHGKINENMKAIDKNIIDDASLNLEDKKVGKNNHKSSQTDNSSNEFIQQEDQNECYVTGCSKGRVGQPYNCHTCSESYDDKFVFVKVAEVNNLKDPELLRAKIDSYGKLNIGMVTDTSSDQKIIIQYGDKIISSQNILILAYTTTFFITIIVFGAIFWVFKSQEINQILEKPKLE